MATLRTAVGAASVIATLVLAPPAAAKTVVGVTSAVNPMARGVPPGQPERILQVGLDMQADERVITGPEGRTHLIFLDGSNLSVGPNSELVIDKFVYDPATKTGQLALSAARGVFRVVGGQISKSGAIEVRTPSAVIGLRGGIAVITVPEGQPSLAMFLFGRDMTVTAAGAMQVATRPGSAISVVPGQAPAAPVMLQPAALQAAVGQLQSPPAQSPAEKEKLAAPGAAPVQAAAASAPGAPPGQSGPGPLSAASVIEERTVGVSETNVTALAPPANVSAPASSPAQQSGGNVVNDVVSDTAAQVITATPPNSPPSFGLLPAGPFATIPENAAAGAAVATVIATDPDGGQSLSYSIVGGSPFAINSQTGQITVANAGALNFEAQTSFNLTVQATDSAGASARANVTVALSNVIEPPAFGLLPAAGTPLTTIAENTAFGAPVATLTATPDAGRSVSYSIVGDSPFAINPTTGAITVANPVALNYEAQTSLNLTVRATDSSNLTTDANVTLALTDVAENFVGRFLRDPAFVTESFVPSTLDAQRNTANNFGVTATEIAGPRLLVTTPVGDHSFPYLPGQTFDLTDGAGGNSTTLFDGVGGRGFVAFDQQFHFYLFFQENQVSAGFAGGVPTPVFPITGFARHALFDPGNNGGVPFNAAGCNHCTSGVISPLFSAYSPVRTFLQTVGNDQRAVHMQASLGIFGSGAAQQSFLIGETGTYFSEDAALGIPDTVSLNGFARGSSRNAGADTTINVPTIFHSSAVSTAETPGGNAIFGPNAEYMFLVPEQLDTIGVAPNQQLERTPQAAIGVPFDSTTAFFTDYPVAIAFPMSNDFLGIDRTTRTLTGFVGGLMETRSTVPTLTFTNSLFVGGALIETSAENNRLAATFELRPVDLGPITHVLNFGSLTGPAGGRSAFIDDNIFAARDANNVNSTRDPGPGVTGVQTPVTDRMFMVTSNTVPLTTIPNGLNPADAIAPCACDFMKWGWWVAEVLDTPETRRDRVHLATWVAGVQTTAEQLNTLQSQGAQASYSGHAIGNVLNGSAKYIAAGGYRQDWNFGTRTGTAFIDNFDRSMNAGNGISLSGPVASAPSSHFLGFGTLASTNIANFGGGAGGNFFQSATDPVAGVGGAFVIGGPNYQAAGTFAAQK
jgi:Cadherin domain/FecR protein